MKDPQRLEPDPDGYGAAPMEPDSQGGYVAYEDYQALRKVSDDLLSALEEAVKMLDDMHKTLCYHEETKYGKTGEPVHGKFAEIIKQAKVES